MCALEAEEAYATAPDGVRLFYRVSGKGPFALVMPVTWGMDSYVYTKGLSSLEFWLALVTFDPRGVGRSDPAASPSEFSVEAAARDGATVADAVGLSRSVVLGHSGGGAVALSYALLDPQRLSHLVLLSTAAQWNAPSPLSLDAGFPRTEAEMRQRMQQSMVRAVREPARFSRAMNEFLPKMRFAPDRLRWTAEVGAKAFDIRGRLGEIRAPTLILQGRDDTMVPLACAEELHRGIQGSQLVVFDDCGHWPHVEKRLEFVAAVKAFLELEDHHQRLF